MPTDISYANIHSDAAYFELTITFLHQAT